MVSHLLATDSILDVGAPESVVTKPDFRLFQCLGRRVSGSLVSIVTYSFHNNHDEPFRFSTRVLGL